MHGAVGLTLIALFAVLTILEVPIAFSLGLSALATIAIHMPRQGLDLLADTLRGAIQHEPLMAIPLFIMAGMAFSRSGVAARLVRLARLLLGRVPGRNRSDPGDMRLPGQRLRRRDRRGRGHVR